MNKKIIAGILALTLTLSAVPFAGENPVTESTGISASAVFSGKQSGDFVYDLYHADQIYIARYLGTDENVVIPDKIDGKPVTYIAESAFANNKKIKSIVLPKEIFSVDSNAFQGCSSLESVTIPGSISDLQEYAFKDCTSLKTVNFTGKMNCPNLEKGLFEGCTSLESFKVPEGIRSICSYAFHNCTKLKTITFPDSYYNENNVMNGIYNFAFMGCESLSSIKVPNTSVVGNGAFMGCTNLKDITIPFGVFGIEEKAFGYDTEGDEIPEVKYSVAAYSEGEDYVKNNGFDYNVDLSLNKVQIEGLKSVYTYTGKPVTPSVKVAVGDDIIGKHYLNENTDYTLSYENNVKTGKAYLIIKGTGKYKGTYKKSFSIAPATTTATMAGTSSSAVRLSWKASTAAAGYNVYRYDSAKKKWAKIATIKNPKTTQYRVTGLKSGTTYKFKVKAYSAGGVECASPKTTVAITTPAKVSADYATSYGWNSAVLYWKKVYGASGYQAHISSDAKLKGGKYVVTDSKKANGVFVNLVKGRKYYVRVRAYKMLNGKKYYGAFSKVLTVIAK